MKRIYCFSGLFILCLSSLGCFTVPGQRLLTVQIELDGVSILESLWAVSDSLTKPDAWKTMVNAPLEPVNRWQPAASSGDNATVTGTITIQLDHASQTYIKLRTNEIKLVKDKSGSWKLAEETVEKLAQDVK